MKGFLDLPEEIRARIYNYVLRPDCKLDHGHCSKQHEHCERFHGCANILRTCKTVYLQAIEHLQTQQPELFVPCTGMSVFRHPKAFGKPGYFGPPTCTEFPRLTELQFLRLRSLCLVIDCDYHFGPGDNPSALKQKLYDVAKALPKSRYIRFLRLRINRMLEDDSSTYIQDDKQFRVRAGIWAIVLAAESQGCEVVIDRDPRWIADGKGNDDEPLIPWLVQKAYAVGIYVERAPDLVRDVVDNDSEVGGRGLWEAEVEVNNVDEVNLEGTIYGLLEEDMTRWPKSGATEYSLTPECRHCYALFGTRAELRDHLARRPDHAVPFRVKQRFEVVAERVQYPAMSCRVCAASFSGAKWREHNRETGHHRADMIPMYVEDDRWWNALCRRAKHEKRPELLGVRVA
jgi:hypothetical protein